jgi:hypothetical protein
MSFAQKLTLNSVQGYFILFCHERRINSACCEEMSAAPILFCGIPIFHSLSEESGFVRERERETVKNLTSNRRVCVSVRENKFLFYLTSTATSKRASGSPKNMNTDFI